MQNNVSITTKEEDLCIKYGVLSSGAERETARTSVKYIYTDLCDIRKNFIRLGFHLSEFERCEYYKDFGYSSISEFAENNLGMDKSAVSRYINVFRCFSEQNKDGGRSMYLADKYQNYSFSQLSEMISLPENKLKMIKPDMTIKQIREVKKGNVSRGGENVSQVATSQPDNKLNIEKFINLRGAALQAYVKKCEPSSEVILELFDKNGKPISEFNNVWVDLMCVKKDHVVLRLPTVWTEKEG